MNHQETQARSGQYGSGTASVTSQAQVRGDHGMERYYLYEHDANPAQDIEVQYDNGGIQGAAETFLLPDLWFTQQYPHRAEYIGPMGWDLVDPLGEVVPCVAAMTSDGRRFIVGVADWPDDEGRTLEEHWASLGGSMRTEIATMWAKWLLENRHQLEARHA